MYTVTRVTINNNSWLHTTTNGLRYTDTVLLCYTNQTAAAQRTTSNKQICLQKQGNISISNTILITHMKYTSKYICRTYSGNIYELCKVHEIQSYYE